MSYHSRLAVRQSYTHTDHVTDRGKAFFGDRAAMVAPIKPPAPVSHLKGEYPQEKQPHKCNTYWHAKVNEAGQVMSMGKARYEAWRHIITKGGKLLHCPMCWHERAKGFCEGIERIGLQYRDWETLRYTVVPNSEYSALQARKRKHNQRARERGEPEINIVAFPGHTSTVVLHDAPAEWLEGDPLPTERPLLYALVSDWASTPKGKRAGRGLGTWGESQESKGKTGGRERYDTCQNPECGKTLEYLQRLNPNVRKYCSDECRQAAAERGDDNNEPVAARIYGQNWPKMVLLVSRYLDIDGNMKGMSFGDVDFYAGDLVALLDAAGMDYVIDGEIKGVTDKPKEPKDISVNRDTPRQPDLLTGEPGGHEGGKSSGPPEVRPINWGALA